MDGRTFGVEGLLSKGNAVEVTSLVWEDEAAVSCCLPCSVSERISDAKDSASAIASDVVST